MRAILLGVILIAGSGAFGQPAAPSPNDAPAGHSAEAPKTPEHSASEHAAEAASGESTHGAAGTVAQGEEHAKASVEHGEGEGEHAMPNEIWWKWANFAILFGGLAYMIGKHAGPFFAARTASIQQGISDAAQVKAEAEARAREIESRIGSLSADVDTMRRQSKEEVAAESARLQAETAQRIAKIQAQAEAEITAAAKHASADLKAYSAGLALELAEAQIRQQMSPDIQRKLAESFVEDLRGNEPEVVH